MSDKKYHYEMIEDSCNMVHLFAITDHIPEVEVSFFKKGWTADILRLISQGDFPPEHWDNFCNSDMDCKGPHIGEYARHEYMRLRGLVAGHSGAAREVDVQTEYGVNLP